MGTVRDAILGVEDLPREKVETPEWASAGVESVWVRGLTGAEREDFEDRVVSRNPRGRATVNMKNSNIRASLVVLAMVDDAGNRVFDDKDIPAVAKKSGVVLDRLFDKIRELSGMLTEEELQQAPPFEQEDTNSSD